VYPLRETGKRLDRALARARVQTGWLTLLRPPAGQPVHVARVIGTAGEPLLQELYAAQVKKIDRGGILISGLEQPVSGLPCVQAWFCVPALQPEGVLPPLESVNVPRHR
jgi:hypothetical protein